MSAPVHQWPPLESDPESFQKLATFLGIEGASIHEVFGFDEELLAFLPQPVMGVIALYNRLPDKKAVDKARGNMSVQHEYYMKQSGTLDNACGIIALIHAALNNPRISLKEGSPLAKFQAANAGKTPEERCSALETSDDIHGYYKEVQLMGNDGNLDGVHEHGGVKKTFHFVAYVQNAKGDVMELDGTKEGPYVIKEGVEDGGLMKTAAAELLRRVADGEIDGDAMSCMVLAP